MYPSRKGVLDIVKILLQKCPNTNSQLKHDKISVL